MILYILFAILFILIVGPIAYTFIADWLQDRKFYREINKENQIPTSAYDLYMKKAQTYFEKESNFRK